MGQRRADGSAVLDRLKAILFEQTADVLEKRFGFRVQGHGACGNRLPGNGPRHFRTPVCSDRT